jgi:hypothetical protein
MDVTASKNKTNLLLLSVTIYLCTLLLVGINRTLIFLFLHILLSFITVYFAFLYISLLILLSGQRNQFLLENCLINFIT